jgi:hypothetical protein
MGDTDRRKCDDRATCASVFERGLSRIKRPRNLGSHGVARFLTAAIAVSVAVAAFLHGLDLASRLEQTSDSAQGFVAAHDLLGGNVLLSGWHFPFDNYYFTDTVPYAALELIAGPRSILLAVAPATIYAIFACIALAVSMRRGQPRTRNLVAIAAVAILLAAPAWIGSWNPLLMSDLHFASVLLALAALWMCAVVAQSRQGNLPVCVGRCAGLLLLVSAAVASDAFSLVFAFGPALAVLAADVALGRSQPHARLALLLLAGGIALGAVQLAFIAQAGGFTIESHVQTGVVPLQLLGRNVIAVSGSILTLFGIYPIGAQFSGPTVILLVLHALAFVLAVAAFSFVARRQFGNDPSPAFDRMLAAGIVTVLIACATSTQFGKGISAEMEWRGGPPMRYVMPVFLFAAVLAGRQTPDVLAAMKCSRLRAMVSSALMVFALLAVVAGDPGVFKPAPRWILCNPPALAAQWLKGHGLVEGVGEYWASNLVTAMSGDSVHVRSVVADGGKLVPYVWSSDANWYMRPPQFAIWQDNNPTGLTYADVRATYAICRTAFVAGYRIAVLATTKCH